MALRCFFSRMPLTGYLQLGNNPVDGNSNLRLVPEKRACVD